MSETNFQFANTSLGAKSSAVIFNLIETAKENGLDSYRYLTFVLKEATKLRTLNPDWARKLTPESAPRWCMAKP